MGKKKYAVWAAAGIAVLVGIIVFCVLAFSSSAKAKELEEQLSLANRYLQELDYENAVAAFQSALEIEPKSEEAYLGLAEAYVGLGDYEAALQALTEGIEKTQSDALREKLSEVEALAGISDADSGASGGDGSVGVLNGAGGAAAPDGEEQADGRNAYGAVVFEERADYREFSELTAQEQELVETCANGAIAHDGGLLDAVARAADGTVLHLLTRWGEYKVAIDLVRHVSFSPFGGGQNTPDAVTDNVRVTLRPENGTGYLYYQFENVGPILLIDEGVGDTPPHYTEGTSTGQRWLECPCTDWQWNGGITGEWHSETDDRGVYPDGDMPDGGHEAAKTTVSTTISGSAAMGLLQGEYVEEAQQDNERHYKGRSETEYFSEAYTLYQENYVNGWMQSPDGSWILRGPDHDTSYFFQEYPDSPADWPENVLEELFW